VDKKLKLFVVADGMGGHAAGEVASSVAVHEVRRVLSDGRDVIEQYRRDETATNREAVLDLIERSIESACSKVFRLAEEDASKKGMGTTLSLFLVAGSRGFIGHVGDSRIYLVRRSGVHQLTEDHSLINELIKRGRLKPGDVFDSPYKNAVTRAVGVYEKVEVDAFDIDVLPEDGFLLCSDGLSCYLDDETTRRFMMADDVKTIPDDLIGLANDCGGKDNITAIVVRMLAGEVDVPQERVTMVQRKTTALQAQPLFRYLNYGEIVKVLNLSKRETLETGDVLFAEGDQVSTMFVVLAGRLQVTSGTRRLKELTDDAFIGESILVDSSPQTKTIIALEKTDVLVMERDAIHALMMNQSKLSWKILWSLTQQQTMRLKRSGQLVHNMSKQIQRLAHEGNQAVPEIDLDPIIHELPMTEFGPTYEVMPPFAQGDSERGTDPMVDRRHDSENESMDDSTPAAISERGPTRDIRPKTN
ncbi:MAG: protein phosphatase 2C domain-containing protein, partial [Myxococcota bacterium]|nr:protein phosphatase 2C domain-containing protein [Myxococcota bacterium]